MHRGILFYQRTWFFFFPLNTDSLEAQRYLYAALFCYIAVCKDLQFMEGGICQNSKMFLIWFIDSSSVVLIFFS